MLKFEKISQSKNKDLVHIGFEVGLIIKGIDGLLEILGSFLLLYLNPNRMSSLVTFLTQHELSEDPKDLVANTLIQFSHGFSISTQAFAIFYLASHGLIKCVLIFLLWRKKLWAYPLTIVSLLLFIAYQMYRYSVHASVSLLLLTVFDIIMIILTFIEYRS
jgi:uncharacterized membrane protein